MSIESLIVRVRESLFTIPIVVVLACVGAAVLALYADSNFADQLEGFPLILNSTVAGGRGIASTVASATITVAAIVFSITALSTQMAANQYSPRALGGFFENPFQQGIIGLVVGTFTYALLVLASLSNAIIDGSDPTPSISVTVAIALGVLSAVGIVAYINHSLRRMQIDSVVRRIADGSIRAIGRHLESPDIPTPESGAPPDGPGHAVKADSGGWVVAINPAAVLKAIPAGATARVDVRIGEAVSVGDRVATLWTGSESEPDHPGKLRAAIVTAKERSIELDPTFGIRQLVDIALRALSPGVNDPTTAVDVIHHLKTPVRTVLVSDAPQRVFAGPESRRVFLAQAPGRSDYVHAAFSEIRLAAVGQPYVLKALIEVLEELESDLLGEELEARAGAVREELRLTLETLESSNLPEPDRNRVLRDSRHERDETADARRDR